MRPLTEEETKTLFQKLAEYMGRSVEHLINRSDERHCFRLIKVCDFVFLYYVTFEISLLLLSWSNVIIFICNAFYSKKDRVYYISESVMKASSSIKKDNLLHCGTCLGKFTKSGKFRLHITALDYLAQYSKVRLVLV
jgi:60S ribosome subunit biogenesis protein NIP7